jgi:hypothetical protein
MVRVSPGTRVLSLPAETWGKPRLSFAVHAFEKFSPARALIEPSLDRVSMFIRSKCLQIVFDITRGWPK